MLLVYRADAPIQSVAVVTENAEFTAGNPAVQTLNAAADTSKPQVLSYARKLVTA